MTTLLQTFSPFSTISADGDQRRRFHAAAKLLGDLVPDTRLVDMDGANSTICAETNRHYGYAEVSLRSLDRFLVLTHHGRKVAPFWVAESAPNAHALTELLREGTAKSKDRELGRIVLDLDEGRQLNFTARVRVEIEWDGSGPQ